MWLNEIVIELIILLQSEHDVKYYIVHCFTLVCVLSI